MPEIDEWSFERQSDRLYFHFDVSEHFLKLETFIRTAESASRVIGALNAELFDGTLDYEIIVLPPEPGTFLSKLAIFVTSIGSVFAFVNSDVGSAYIEGLTGKPSVYWAKQVGETSHDLLEKGKVALEAEQPPTSVTPPVPKDTSEQCRVGAQLVTDMARGVLEKDPIKLRLLGIDGDDRMIDALEARGDFYRACIDDREVKRIGFTPEGDFPIPRNSFPERAQKPERKEKEDEPLPWMLAIENVRVTSPNWERDDQKARQWKGKDSVRRECFFVIEDAEFWFHVKRKDLIVDVLDNLKVQWAYQVVGKRIKNRRVLRVLEFNGEKLADPLSDDAVRAMLGQFTNAETPPANGDLFDDTDR
ncbi:hypothetical protein [Acidimangrovimonas pyrenivorans]|uniref:Uncharacterized protein n=1 Tax=Acidimangrovimonas pyrenivorans TaxID=2030798 RepID=A0ABV7AKV5_9RHOB